MNIGQVLENHLGWIAKTGWDITEVKEAWADRLARGRARPRRPGFQGRDPVFDGADESEITGLLENSLTTRDGNVSSTAAARPSVFDGRSGEPYPERTGVGYMYMLKLHHLVDDKIHARSHRPVLDDHPAAAGR